MKNNKFQKFLEKFDNLGVYAVSTLAPVGVLVALTTLTPITYVLIGAGLNVGAFLFTRTYFDFYRKDLINNEDRLITDNLHTELNRNFNILNNIFLPLGIFFITKSALALALGFIAYDIVSVGIENLTAKTYISKIEDKKILSKIDDYFYYKKPKNNYQKYIAELAKEKLEFLNQKEIEEKEAKETQNNIFEKRLTSEYDMFESLFDKLKDYPYDENAVPDDEYEVLLEKVTKINKSLNKDKDLISVVDVTTLETYVDAFIEVLDNFIEIDLENNEDYDNKLTEIVNEFTNYLDRILSKIEEENKMKADVSYNVLLNNIKNAE